MSEQVMHTTDTKSRTRALILAVTGLVGMFLALVGATGLAQDAGVWGAKPAIWLTLGLIIAVASAVADAALGARADFTTGAAAKTRGAVIMNRFLPWIIVVLTLIGIAIILVRG